MSFTHLFLLQQNKKSLPTTTITTTHNHHHYHHHSHQWHNPPAEMGNILGSQRVFYAGYEYHRGSADGSRSHDDDDVVYARYGWRQFLRVLLSGPAGSGGNEARGQSRSWEARGGWGGKVVGIQRKKGCINRDHWALKFQPGIDTSQLPRRVKGFRTKIPSRCKKNCG
ncbi:uncharacterized protein F4812DRAFT_454166 [Daldinia caldariorum]|uniref:uncharacterized protein n=1 Tax=Daldinia caldariorum TaxID=326644 RepID=UPI0020084435|nr:uncharacterized protein F4812DRAFT_454166 [Daldinia caldariorum]KAI1472349.1 hypothetical protein F4812DRAFT_454166 [Daldinia caldariorum]